MNLAASEVNIELLKFSIRASKLTLKLAVMLTLAINLWKFNIAVNNEVGSEVNIDLLNFRFELRS